MLLLLLLLRSSRLPISRKRVHVLLLGVHISGSAALLLQLRNDASIRIDHVGRCSIVHLLLLVLGINRVLITLNDLDAFLALSHFGLFVHCLNLGVIELIRVDTLLALFTAFLVLLVHEFLKKIK